MNTLEKLYPRRRLVDIERRVRFHKGGGTPAMPAPAAPPPSATATEVQLQRRDTLKNAQKRKGMQSTILAGEGESEAANSGKATLLGGGS